jgi:death-on-curing protein
MATEQVRYVTYLEAVAIHFKLMRRLGEVRYGIWDRTLIESALARPHQAAHYDRADLLEQAATLCYGLIKNHPWRGGNKRTATTITDAFLKLNGLRIVAPTGAIVELVLMIESDEWLVAEIHEWLKNRTLPYVDSPAGSKTGSGAE